MRIDRGFFLRALDLFAEYGLDFEDCLTIAHVEREELESVVSYDPHFDKVAGIRRDEP
jgi:predicted nucleic acid-binding protein